MTIETIGLISLFFHGLRNIDGKNNRLSGNSRYE
jgi:hypothetical protein